MKLKKPRYTYVALSAPPKILLGCVSRPSLACKAITSSAGDAEGASGSLWQLVPPIGLPPGPLCLRIDTVPERWFK